MSRFEALTHRLQQGVNAKSDHNIAAIGASAGMIWLPWMKVGEGSRILWQAGAAEISTKYLPTSAGRVCADIFGI